MPTTKARNKQAAKKIDIIRAQNLDRLEWLVHGFSTRRGGVSKAYGEGDLNLGFTEHDPHTAVERNRIKFLKALRASKMTLVGVRQVHSDIIHRVNAIPEQVMAGDGLITDKPGLLLSIRTADCFPVLLVDTKHRAVAALHAGWRGTLARIVEKGLGELRKHYGTQSEDVQAAIGPGIGGCCYKVGEEIREKFMSRFAYAEELFHETEEYDEVKLRYPMLFLTARAPGHSHDLFPKAIHLDLAAANRRQLRDAGLAEENISIVGECTSCKVRRYFSHRKEKGVTGRMMAVVGITGA